MRPRVMGLLAGTIVLAVAVPAAAQFLPSRPGDYDRVRAGASFWRGPIDGTLRLREIDELFPNGLDLDETLGLTGAEQGWLLEANLAAARRHRFLFSASQREHGSATRLTDDLVGGLPVSFEFDVEAALRIEELRGHYNVLVLANDVAELGLLVGAGYFQVDASLDTNFGGVGAVLDTPYPSVGGNLLVGQRGPIRGYVEITGFPEVEVDDLSGWLLDALFRVEVFPIPNVGGFVGYRQYRILLEEMPSEIEVDVRWRGVIIGAVVRF